MLTEYDDVQFNKLGSESGPRPLSLTSADFDEDGVPDLVTGYGSDSGGTIMLHRGNVDSIFPNSPEGKQSKGNDQYAVSPFLSRALVFAVPEPPDFIAAGDFDGDSHWDVVTGARGSSVLYLLLGDGRGNLKEAQKVELAGRTTAMVCGDINRRDGLADLVVAVTGPQGNQALVFESPEGALRGEPEAIPLPAEASALAIGQLDDDYAMDLAIAAGKELLIVQGRDRRLSIDETHRAQVTPAKIERIPLPSKVSAMAIGDFVRDYHSEIAVLSEEGRIQLVSRKNTKWAVESLGGGTFAATSQIVSARVSSLPYDNLVLVDAKDNQLHILIDSQPSETRDLQSTSSTLRPLTPVTLDVEDAPVTVLPMRLNGDALSDLAILKKGANPIAVALTAPMSTFMVTNTNDSGAGSLRQAITDAKNNAGLDAISFNISGSGVHTISPLSALLITTPVIIDGYTQPLASPNGIANGDNAVILIELNGTNLHGGVSGLHLQAEAGGSTIRGLVINRFPDNGIYLDHVSGNIIQGNFIGTNAAGTADLGNANHGVNVDVSHDNTLGGTLPAARNLISGNDNLGLQIFGVSSTGNMVQGNFIGTNANGTASIGNTSNGVFLQIAPNNTVGGPVAGARNVISGNNSNGVAIFSAGSTGNLVQGNFIGTDVSGTAPVGNSANGVFLSSSANNTIGGTFAGAGNVIAFNGARGVYVSSETGNSILSNSIYSNFALGIDLDPVGVTNNDACDGDSGANSLQNFPVLSSASTTNVQGTLNSTANTTFRIEFFVNPACDSSGNGEGKTFLAATNVTTNGSCIVNFGFTFPSPVPSGQFITATATDPSGNTSEFSQCVHVTGGGGTGRTPSDFDGDGKTDIAIWRPSNGGWYTINSSNGATNATGWGISGDVIVPGDYDGDGKTDIAVWRPSTGVWFIIQSSNGTTTNVGWGINGDVPAPGDYDGDGKTDIAVWRPVNGSWYIIRSSDGTTSVVNWGVNGDKPVATDYDGDGKTDIAVWRPSNGTWHIINSSNASITVVGWGIASDKTVAADYDGDGKADVAVWRPSNGTWYILKSTNGAMQVVGWGVNGDVAAPGDYDGDGKTDVAVWRPATGTWYIQNSADGSVRTVVWGVNGDLPVPSAYVR